MLRKVGHELGLTKRTETELTDILEAEGKVRRKSLEVETFIFSDLSGSYPRALDHVGRCEKHYVLIETTPSAEDSPRTFELCGQDWYDSLNEGDLVQIFYRDQYQKTTDYAPPEFSSRQQLGEPELVGYSIEKITVLPSR
jgi:hypothetical protein